MDDSKFCGCGLGMRFGCFVARTSYRSQNSPGCRVAVGTTTLQADFQYTSMWAIYDIPYKFRAGQT